LDLVPARQRIENPPRINYSHDTADAQAGEFWLPGNLDEVTAERMRRELRLWIAKGGFGLAAARDQAQVGALEQSCEGRYLGRTVSLHEDSAAFKCEFVGLAVLEGRSWRCRCDGQQRCDRAVSRCKDRRNHGPGRHRTARERAFRKRRIAKH